jgi:D-methionine transport system substrate-binding protein
MRDLWLLIVLGLSACHQQDVAKEDKTIKLITSDLWPMSESVPILKAELAKKGYLLDWVVVNDIIQPNKMVEDGTADANQFQHEPYFEQFVQDHGLKNVTRGFYTFVTPAGLYSTKYKSLDQVPDGATIGIPVDPANNGRALFMLQDKGLLKLKPGVAVTHASQKDIVENPHRFKFKEVDQLMQQRTLPDVDVGFLFSNYAHIIGLDPTKDALALEDVSRLPYRGIVAIRKDLVGSPKIKALQDAFLTDAYKAFYRGSYGDVIIFLDHLNR